MINACRRRLILAVVTSVALQSGMADDAPTKKAPDMNWLDRPDVLTFIFHPRQEREADAAPRRHRRLEIPVAPGVTIGGRAYTQHPQGPTILFFHGNGEIVADYDQLALAYLQSGINFVAVDYRGYGRSTGQPTTAALLADAQVCFQFTRQWLKEQDFTGALVVMGRSLGSAAALEIAAAQPQAVAGLIIDSGFANTAGLLRRLGGTIPETVRDASLRQTEKMRLYPGPVLILHGAEDRLIPFADAEALYDAASDKQKKLIKFEGAGHNDIFAVALPQYLKAIGEFVSRANR